jgi:hypothetical protein
VREDVIVEVNRRARPGRNTGYALPVEEFNRRSGPFEHSTGAVVPARQQRRGFVACSVSATTARAANRPERLARPERAKQPGKS